MARARRLWKADALSEPTTTSHGSDEGGVASSSSSSSSSSSASTDASGAYVSHPGALAPASSPVAEDDEEDIKRVILTFSGKEKISAGSELWTRVANVMKRSEANIEAAGSTFVRMPWLNEETHESFSVSAFGANISPSFSIVDNVSQEELLGCTMYVKAILPTSRVGAMMNMLQKRSPLQVYTVSIGDVVGRSNGEGATSSAKASARATAAAAASAASSEAAAEAAAAAPEATRGRTASRRKSQQPHSASPGTLSLQAANKPPSAMEPAAVAQDYKPRTGTMHLFGIDRPGQLSMITKTLSRFGVRIMNLRVQSGVANAEKCDFMPASGGPLAENLLKVSFDECEPDEELLSREVHRMGCRAGYAVTCIMLDSDFQLQSARPSYYLERKAFTASYLNAVHSLNHGHGAPAALGRSADPCSLSVVASANAEAAQAARAARRQQEAANCASVWRRRQSALRRRTPAVASSVP